VTVQHQPVGGRRRLGEPPAFSVLLGGQVLVWVTGRVQVVRSVARLDELVELTETAVETIIVKVFRFRGTSRRDGAAPAQQQPRADRRQKPRRLATTDRRPAAVHHQIVIQVACLARQ